MAQGTLAIFQEFAVDLGDKTHDFGNDTIKVALITDSVTAAATDVTPVLGDYTQVTGGNGYTTGGETIGSVTWTEAAGVATLDGAAVSWTKNASGPTDIFQAVIYNDTAATDECLAFVDMTADGGTTPISLVAGSISLDFNASGILTVTVS